MTNKKNKHHDIIYLSLIAVIGFIIFFKETNFSNVASYQWSTVAILILCSSLLAYFTISLPLNGNSFSLDSSIYLAILFIYGLEITLIVLFFTFLIDFFLDKKLPWWKHICNFSIYTVVLYATDHSIKLFHLESFSNETLVGYIAILLVYVILNTLILSVYFALKQRTSITNTIIELTQQAVTTYLITLIIAILVSFLLVSSHIIGVLLFTAVALLISFSYRSYFKIFDELRGMKQTYQSLFDYNPDLVFIFNLNGQLSKANENFTKVTGYEESYFKTNLFSTIIVPQYIATAITTFEKVTSGNPQNELIEIFHKNGNILKMEVTIVPLVVEKEIKGVIGYAKDVTKMKETEDLLRRSEKLSVVGELAAGVAHEIRNPLTTIRGFLQFEKNSLKDSSYQDIMIAEIDRINFIVSEFLSLAKPQKLVFEKRSIHSIVKEITTLSKSEANLNSVAIEFTSEDNLPPINCEKNQLKQVFINILKNGIEAMPNGGKITISISSNSDYVIVRFVDEGIGIPKERIDRIGEPFFTLKEKGMGLGMTMSYKIMEEHNGDIKINSEVGVGTTVEVLLPIA